ncbi:hypothetical protein J6590_091437 [Homalodisca vitripennis]|nr:hypothetical protein J6590_005101 [Homalodisca vitripennis]KAG8304549.1 hypothetical protein J6590_091437 [Homalodisca vitripennis]
MSHENDIRQKIKLFMRRHFDTKTNRGRGTLTKLCLGVYIALFVWYKTSRPPSSTPPGDSNYAESPSRDHFWLVYTYQLNPPLGTAKSDVPLQSGQPYGCPVAAHH